MTGVQTCALPICYDAPEYEVSLLTERVADGAQALAVVDAALASLDAIGEAAWERDAIEAAIRGMEAVLALKPRKFISVLYVAEMGRAQGIPLFDSLGLLGRARSLARLRAARAMLEHQRA